MTIIFSLQLSETKVHFWQLEKKLGVRGTLIKVHLNPISFSAEMKLSNIHKRNLPIFLVSDIFKGFKN